MDTMDSANMSSNRWFTKEDIINDLAEITGAGVTNIDDKFAVSGKRPPPISVSDEDEDEFVQMYGQYSSRDIKATEPDLSGITHMVRMVNDYYDCATYDDIENIKELKKAASTVISISKLDPNVPEFIPKNVEKTSSEPKNVAKIESTVKPEFSDDTEIRKCSPKNLDVQNLFRKNDNEIHKTDADDKNETNRNDIDVTKKIDVSSLNSNEIKDIREKLKQKIVCTAKTQCFNKKRERNLAMASLLKLHTDVPNSTKNDPPNLKLKSPEYFQTFPKDVKNSSICTEAKEIKIEENIKEEIEKDTIDKEVKLVFNTPDAMHESWSNPMTSSGESIDLVINTKSDSNLEKQRFDLLMSREEEESIKKVNKWFNGPKNKKHKPRISFGPVTFKKRDSDSNSSEMQSHSITDITEVPSSSQTSDSFVPSAYANELTRSYMERSQSKVLQHEDIWTKLERELREKDMLLAKQSQK